MKYCLFIWLFILPFYSMSQKYQSALWEISGNGLKQKSYLFGTIHTVPSKTIKKISALEQIIRKCEVGIFEITDTDPRATDATLKAQAFPPLDSVFSLKEYAVVDSFFIKAGYGSIKDHNNDASISGMIQIAMGIKQFPASLTDMGIDDHILKMMIDDEKPRIQLDDPNVRARNEIATSSPKEDAKVLMAIIESSKQPGVLDSVFSAIDSITDIKSYRSSLTYDFMLSKSVSLNSPETTKLNQAAERNLLWLPIIDRHISTQSCFIAVGIWHLRYKSGLISLLRKKGYTLKPVVLNSDEIRDPESKKEGR